MSADRMAPAALGRRRLLGTIGMLPLAAEAVGAPAAHPDAALIAMADELKRLELEGERLSADTPPDPDDAFLDMVEANDQARFDLRKRILAMHSTTMEGRWAQSFALWSVYLS